jgi:hypothetical protein
MPTHRSPVSLHRPYELTYFGWSRKDTVATHLAMGEDWRVPRQ